MHTRGIHKTNQTEEADDQIKNHQMCKIKQKQQQTKIQRFIYTFWVLITNILIYYYSRRREWVNVIEFNRIGQSVDTQRYGT